MSVLEALVQLTALDRLPRTGWLLRAVPDPESIAGHTRSTAYVALACMSKIEPALDGERVLSLALLHDAAEASSGDIPRQAGRNLPPGAKRAMEARLCESLFDGLPEAFTNAPAEMREQSSREARFVHACDEVQLGVQGLVYHRRGQRGLDAFRAAIAELDCSEFPPLEALREEILAAWN